MIREKRDELIERSDTGGCRRTGPTAPPRAPAATWPLRLIGDPHAAELGEVAVARPGLQLRVRMRT